MSNWYVFGELEVHFDFSVDIDFEVSLSVKGIDISDVGASKVTRTFSGADAVIVSFDGFVEADTKEAAIKIASDLILAKKNIDIEGLSEDNFIYIDYTITKKVITEIDAELAD